MNYDTLNEAAARLMSARLAEKQAKEARLKAEDDVDEALLEHADTVDPEGIIKVETELYSVQLKRKVSRKVDADVLALAVKRGEIPRALAKEVFPPAPKLDLRKFRKAIKNAELEDDNTAAVYLASVVTVKPAKPDITVSARA